MGILKKFYRFLSDARFRFFVMAKLGLYDRLSDEKFVKRLFKIRLGYNLDLDNPRTFCEKLQYLKVYDHKDEYTTMVDKYLVKDYVANKIGQEYIIPTYGVWDKFDDIKSAELPNQFVLKCTHNSGSIVICKDKKNFDFSKARKILSKDLSSNYYRVSREWPYKNVKPRIIAEQFIDNGKSKDLMDYKILCFHGKPYLIEIHKGRYYGNHTQDIYDTSWNYLNISQGIEPSNVLEPRPKCLDKMLQLSSILSEGIPHVRVDWYISNDKLLFGELTFFDGSGFYEFAPDEINYQIGDLIVLPKVN